MRNGEQEILTKENFIEDIKNKSFDVVNGHSHDGIDSKLVVAGSIPAHGVGQHTDIARRMFVTTIVNHGGDNSKSLGIALGPATTEKINYICMLPTDFVSVSSIYVIWAASTDEAANNWVLDLTVQAGAISEAYDHHSNGDTGNVIACALNDQYVIRYTPMDHATLFTDICTSDYIGFWLQRVGGAGSDNYAGDIIIRGILINYIANQ